MNTLLRWTLAAGFVASVFAVGARTAPAAPAAGNGRSPAAFELCTSEGPNAAQKCAAFGLPAAYTVPPGRLLVIEQVSGQCSGDDQPGLPTLASILVQTDGVVVPHTIIGVPQSNLPVALIPLTLTRMYADPNSTLTLGLTDVPAISNRLCRIAFSGQLIKR